MSTLDRNSCVDANHSAIGRRLLRECLCALIGLLLSGAVSAKLHRCQDANGQWSFQDRPCPEGTERKEVRARNLAPKGPPQLKPKPKQAAQCTVQSEPFRFESEDLFGVEGRLLLQRDGQTYQLSVQLTGDWVNSNLDPVPLALSTRLTQQGLLIGQSALQSPDWLLDLRRMGFGHSRSQALLEAKGQGGQYAEAEASGDIVVLIWIRGRKQADWSLPLPPNALQSLKTQAQACTIPDP